MDVKVIVDRLYNNSTWSSDLQVLKNKCKGLILNFLKWWVMYNGKLILSPTT